MHTSPPTQSLPCASTEVGLALFAICEQRNGADSNARRSPRRITSSAHGPNGSRARCSGSQHPTRLGDSTAAPSLGDRRPGSLGEALQRQ